MISPVEAIWTATETFWMEKLIHLRAAHVVESLAALLLVDQVDMGRRQARAQVTHRRASHGDADDAPDAAVQIEARGQVREGA